MTRVKLSAVFGGTGPAPVERLVCHPRLPLVAAVDGGRRAVHVLDCGRNELGLLAGIGSESSAYGEVEPWERGMRDAFAVWHPVEPRLLVATEGTVWSWTPTELRELTGLPAGAVYEELLFSPDGDTLWASPSATSSRDVDAIGLVTGEVVVVGVYPQGGAHPSGAVMLTTSQDQGGSRIDFLRVEQGAPADRQLQRLMVLLGNDGYQPPIFSPDGHFFAIRGCAYGETLTAFAFPTLEEVLHEKFDGTEDDGWWRNDITFGAKPGTLWVGTPTGALWSYDLVAGTKTDHGVLAGPPVTAIGCTSLGQLVIGCDNGEILLASINDGAAVDHPVDLDAVRADAAAFLAATEDVPEDVDDVDSFLIAANDD
ncbi:hypothetical protein [Allokutzneria sp. NRRL B-24872]|uniref:hypothetical protein n=1 Tax=Allokutzneria sp. NRRL B-24872 TaxID=1137961 RepID=UPI000A383E72|nr:hypothetical protein [Allokutzneria sp. NRRL B-24872]